MSQPPHAPQRLARISGGPLTTTNRHTRTAPVAPRQRMQTARARYLTVRPQTFHPRPLAPILDERWELKAHLFIGPIQDATIASPSQTPGVTFAGEPFFEPVFPISPDRQPNSTMSTMPYPEKEYERMNGASHLVLHGGN